MTVRNLPVGSLDNLRAALRTIHKERPQVLMVWSSPFLTQHRNMIMNSIAHRIPVISDGRFFSEAGALVTYSVDWPDMFRRSAGYVDKILKGAKPGDLPIEQPTKFELVVNLKTAKALGITMPESILLRADEVIR
jgi:putative ABC transport system substrate-binding protein